MGGEPAPNDWRLMAPARALCLSDSEGASAGCGAAWSGVPGERVGDMSEGDQQTQMEVQTTTFATKGTKVTSWRCCSDAQPAYDTLS